MRKIPRINLKLSLFLLIIILFISCSNKISKLVSEGDKYVDSQDEKELLKAVSSYKKAINAKIEAGDKIVYVYKRLGDLYMRRNMWNNAIDSYKQAIDYIPDKAIVHHNLALCYANKASFFEKPEFYKLALIEYRMAIKIDNGRHTSHYGLGILLFFKMNRHEEGIRELEKVLELRKNYYDAYLALGRAYYQLNDLRVSLNYYKELKKILPSSSELVLSVEKNIEKIYNEMEGNLD